MSPQTDHMRWGNFCNLPKILHYLHCQNFRPVNYPILCPRWNYIRSPMLRVEGLLKVLESTISTKLRIMFIKIGTFDLARTLSSCRARDWDAQVAEA